VFTQLSSQRFLTILRLAVGIVLLSLGVPVQAAPPATPQAPPPAIPDIPADHPIVQLGPGDMVQILVYGLPDLGETVYVGDDGTLPVALAGNVAVAGLSPGDAAKRIEDALRNGKFVNDPHVTVTVSQSRSQRVSVLGEVGSPGRYAIDARTSIFDLLAQAGGTRETGSDVIYLVRTNTDGTTTRMPIDLKGLRDGSLSTSVQALQAGDVLVVPKAQEFYITGEVTNPKKYRIEPNMTLAEAIATAGGITAKGSTHRVEVERRDSSGKHVRSGMKLNDLVQPNDVIHVKESIF
jgi:polysaccharide export outer membrane protein